jgi:FixJ family two-component response regulator
MHVLLVDSDDSLRRALARGLRMAGCDVESFRSVDGLVERGLPASSVCLVLDLEMPGLAELQFRQQLAQRGTTCRTVFISAQDIEDRKALAAAFNPVAVLSKPFTIEALLDAINSGAPARA